MKTTHGGKRDNRKQRPDDKRGGKRTPGHGKKLGRPKKNPLINNAPILNDRSVCISSGIHSRARADASQSQAR